MTTATAIVIVLSVMLLCAGGYALYVSRKAKEYTRERYAFAALASTVNLVGIGLAAAFGKKTPFSAIQEFWSFLTGSPQPPAESLHWSEHALLLTFIVIVIYIIQRPFVTWNGAYSAQDKQRQVIHEDRVWIVEGISEAFHIIRRDPARPLYQPPDRLQEPPLPLPSEPLTWRDNARDLVELRWPSYSFPEDGWHELVSAWIGKNGKTGAIVGLLCVPSLPGDEILTQFAAYVARLHGFQLSNHELLVAIQNGVISEQKQLGAVAFRLVSESSLLDNLVDFSHYFRAIQKLVTEEALPDSDLKICDTYVRPLVVRRDVDVRRSTKELPPKDLEKLPDLLDDWLTESGQRHIALLGEYGQGKSTAALMFAHELIQQGTNGIRRVPLLIELRGMSPSTLPPLQLLGAWCSSYRIEARALMKLIVAGRAVVIFEGFDEMAEAGDPEARLNHFRALWKFAYSRNKMIITGRPNFFLDNIELKTALGIERASGAGPHCEARYLKFFAFDEIEESLRKVKRETREQIIALARAERRFLEIVARPSLLYIVAILWESEGLSQQSNLNSAVIIELFTRHSYRRQAKKTENGREFMTLSPVEREYFMDGIAAYMVARHLSNQIQLDQLRDAVTKLFGLIPDRINLKQPATQLGPTKPLKERLRGRMYPVVDVEHDVRAYGLLVPDYSKPGGAFRFAHKQFFEFIFARIVAHRLQGIDLEQCAAILAATDVSTDRIVDMPESLAFFGEIIAKGSRPDGDVKNLMQSLFNSIVLRNMLRIRPIFARPFILEFYNNIDISPFIPPLGFLRTYYRRPSFLVAIFLTLWLGFAVFYIGSADPALGSLRASTLVLVTMFNAICLMSFASYTVGKLLGADKALWLWRLVIKNMGFDESDVARVYGRKVAASFAPYAGSTKAILTDNALSKGS